MPRPKTPLLDAEKIVTTALELIDESGVDKFSIHALARRLEVKGPSIYYYYKDRDELLTAVGLTVLANIRVPRKRSGDWVDLLVSNAVAYFRAVRAHPNVAGLLLERRTRRSAVDAFEHALEAIDAAGIDPADGLAFIDCIEGIALAWISLGAAADPSAGFGPIDTDRYPLLEAARRKFKHDEASFRRMIRALIDGLRPR